MLAVLLFRLRLARAVVRLPRLPRNHRRRMRPSGRSQVRRLLCAASREGILPEPPQVDHRGETMGVGTTMVAMGVVALEG